MKEMHLTFDICLEHFKLFLEALMNVIKVEFTSFSFFLQTFQFVQKTGDLFSCDDSESLAHCISEDVRMGKGIAVLFKKKFGDVQVLINQGN